jgi:glutaredoxin-related protein
VIADECFILFKCLFHSVRELHRFLHCRDELQRFFTSQKRGRSMIISAEESLATGG